jgi:hypothetical protein
MSAPSGHEHTIDLPVLIGPLALRVVLLAAVCTVTGFALLRAFLGPPARTTTTAALVEFTRALAAGTPTTIPTHTALMLALVGLSWYTLGLPHWRPGSLTMHIVASVLATVTIAGIGSVTAFMSGP